MFEDVGFDLGRGERLLVLGLNGAEKRRCCVFWLANSVQTLATSSLATRLRRVTAQEHDNLDPDRSLLDNLRGSVPPVWPHRDSITGLLGMFGLSGDKVMQTSGTLSGGEKTKLALAMLMTGRNNLLLLDEPTNNLILHLEKRLVMRSLSGQER